MADSLAENSEDADATLATRSWEKMRNEREKAGYREGVAAGQESCLQKGFDQGFQDNLAYSKSLGYMSGVLRGLLALRDSMDIPDLSETSQQEMKKMVEEVDSLQRVAPPSPDQSMTDRGQECSEQSPVSSCTTEASHADAFVELKTEFDNLMQGINLSGVVR